MLLSPRSFVEERSSFTLAKPASTIYTGRCEHYKMKYGNFPGLDNRRKFWQAGVMLYIRTCFIGFGGALLRPSWAAVVWNTNSSFHK